MFVDSAEKIDRVIRMLNDATRVGIDSETIGYDPAKEHPYSRAIVFSMQFTCTGRKVDDVPWSDYIFVPNWGEWHGYLRKFKKFLEDDERKKVFHNAKAEFHHFRNHGIWTRGFKSDTGVMAYLHNTNLPIALKDRVGEHLGLDSPDFRRTFQVPFIKKNGEPGKRMVLPPLNEVVAFGRREWSDGRKQTGLERLVEYACKDPWLTCKLEDYLEAELESTEWTKTKSMKDCYYMFDRPFTEVLFEMEVEGIKLDQNKLEGLHTRMCKDLTRMEKDLFKEIMNLARNPWTRKWRGIHNKKDLDPKYVTEINIDSNKQLAKLLKDELGVDLPETDKGNPSTGADALAHIKSKRAKPLLQLIMDRRSLKDKLIGTYSEPWLEDMANPKLGGRLRTIFRQTGAVTGRLSSANYNLQNIPSPETDPYLIREVFIADEETDEIGDIDLSQIELRLAAHFSKEKVMIEAIRNGMDLHARTTIEVFSEVKGWVAKRPITKELLLEVAEKFKPLRKKAKNTNFMVLYGGGPMRYAEMNDSTPEEGKRVINTFFGFYKGLDAWIKHVRRGCHKTGYIRTLLQRYVHYPNIHSSNQAFRAMAERQCVNAKIQGSAADLLKMAMILIHRDEDLRNDGVKMLLQIHDELVFNMPKGTGKKHGKKIEDYVSHPYRYFGMKDLEVDTPAEMGFGPNWKAAK